MKALLAKDFGDTSNLIIEELDLSSPGKREVRIAIYAFGINFAESVQLSGNFQISTSLPFVPGFEVSGEIVELGEDVEDFKVGDRVLGLMCYGAYAQEVILPTTNIVKMPPNMDFFVGASFPVAYGTAYISLIHRGRLATNAGETVLIHGATGNVGAAAIEICNRLGATVIAVSGSPSKVKTFPDHIINYKKEDIPKRVFELTNGQGADVVLDLVGGSAFNASLDCIAWEGRILTVGFASGKIPEVSLVKILTKNCAIIGEDISGYAVRNSQVIKQALNNLVGWYEEGSLHPATFQVIPLEETAEALKATAKGITEGKLVVKTR